MSRMSVSGRDRASAICAKDATGSLLATFSAFPFAKLIAMLVGGVMIVYWVLSAMTRSRTEWA